MIRVSASRVLRRISTDRFVIQTNDQMPGKSRVTAVSGRRNKPP